MKWWLISDEDVKAIRTALMAKTHEDNDHNCPDNYDYCHACAGDELRKEAVHTLDTGLHETDAIPDDFAPVPFGYGQEGMMILEYPSLCPLRDKCPTYQANQCSGQHYCLHLAEIPVFRKRSFTEW